MKHSQIHFSDEVMPLQDRDYSTIQDITDSMGGPIIIFTTSAVSGSNSWQAPATQECGREEWGAKVDRVRD